MNTIRPASSRTSAINVAAIAIVWKFVASDVGQHLVGAQFIQGYFFARPLFEGLVPEHQISW